jgi:hypothetical protein
MLPRTPIRRTTATGKTCFSLVSCDLPFFNGLAVSVGASTYCIRATSRNCRAVASRNVSTLAPSGVSSPDLACIAARDPIRQSLPRRHAHVQPPGKEPLQHLQVGDDSFAIPLAGSVTAGAAQESARSAQKSAP